VQGHSESHELDDDDDGRGEHLHQLVESHTIVL
jgi:hypothetical protein